MIFSDRIKGDLPFEDDTEFDALDSLIDKLIGDKMNEIVNFADEYVNKVAMFFTIDKYIREERGIEDKEERYRIIDMIIRM